MHCMLMDLLHGFEVLSTTEETLFNSRNVSRLVQNNVGTAFTFIKFKVCCENAVKRKYFALTYQYAVFFHIIHNDRFMI